MAAHDRQARERWLDLMGAGVAFSLALLILLAVGLPDPARLLAVEQDGPADRVFAPVVGALAPAFTALNVDGEPVALAALAGSPVVLNFWATWCGPCEAELPALQAVYTARQAEGLRLLAINVGEAPAVFQPWAAARGLTFDLLPDPDGTLAALYLVRGVPQTVVIAPDRSISAVFYGPITAGQLENALDLP